MSDPGGASPRATPLAPSLTITHGAPPAPVSYRVDTGAGLLGFIAIDSIVDGRARGGLRLVAGLSEDEMRDAARAMTLKYGLLGLPQGGAKAGVIGDPDAPPDERRLRLETFARTAEPLLRERCYIPDADLGTDAGDIRTMMQAIGFPMRARDWRASRSGDHTARSCLAAADVLVARQGLSWPTCRVAIEGFGKVGGAAARLVAERGGRVVAVSTSHGALADPDGLDVERLLARAAASGSRFVLDDPGVLPREALFDVPADVLLPGIAPPSAGWAHRWRVRRDVPERPRTPGCRRARRQSCSRSRARTECRGWAARLRLRR